MPELLNCTLARPIAVTNILRATLRLGANATESEVKKAIYLNGEPPSADHWTNNRDAAITLGLLTADGSVLRANLTDACDQTFRRAAREALAKDRPGDENAIVYGAFREALALELTAGGVVLENDLLTAVQRRTGEAARFNSTKYEAWLNWMTYLGLVTQVLSQRGDRPSPGGVCPAPTRAIREALVVRPLLGAVTVRRFVEHLECEVPVLARPSEAAQLPDGISVALQELEEDGVLGLRLLDDAPEQWRLGSRGRIVSHLVFSRETEP